MADHDHNSLSTESTALNTTLEPTAPEATTESSEVSTTPETAVHAAPVAQVADPIPAVPEPVALEAITGFLGVARA